MSNPLVSVIIPVYRVEEYLDECVESICNQRYSNLEIILVDDGSPDKCPVMCDNWAKKDSRITVIHKQNQGLGLARNSGLKLASGKYVSFIDSDDYVFDNLYSSLIPMLERNNADCIRFERVDVIDGKFDRTPTKGSCAKMIKEKSDIIEMSALIWEYFVQGDERNLKIEANCWGGIYRTDILKQHNIVCPNERELLSEDFIFNFNFLRHASKVLLTDNTYYCYRFNPNSLSRKCDLTKIPRASKLCEHIETIMLSSGYNRKHLSHLYSYLISHFIGFFDAIIDNKISLKEIKTQMQLIKRLPTTQKAYELFDISRLGVKDRIKLFIINNEIVQIVPVWRFVKSIIYLGK